MNEVRDLPTDRDTSSLDLDLLKDRVAQALADARAEGATSAEAGGSLNEGLSVTARLGDVETIERTRDKDLAITVYFGQRSGSASTSDFRAEAIRDTVRAACAIARFTADDPCAGLADPDRLARDILDLDLYHEWALTPDQAIERAIGAEAAARAVDARIRNSEGANVTSHRGISIYGNSHGFMGIVRGTRHATSCSVIAEADGEMQRDDWYTVARDPQGLESPETVGRRAAERALRRLGARKITTRRAHVVFEAPVAASLWSHFVSAVRGTSLYRRASFLIDSLGTPVFSPQVQIHEHPHLRGRLGSAAFDGEGVATAERQVIDQGRVLGYFLDSYSGRKLGMPSTGHSGGVHNLTITPTMGGLEEMLAAVGNGILVTELIGFGVNLVTGDYSRGAAGFLIENGRIGAPVEEITVAGNLREMFLGLAGVGSDVDPRGGILTGSVWIPDLMIAGA